MRLTQPAFPTANVEALVPPRSRLSRTIHRVREALDWSSLGLGLAGTALVFCSIMPLGGIIAAVGMGIHLINNIDNYTKPGATKLETFFKSSMFVAGVSALAWSIVAITCGSSNPVGWVILIVGHVGLAAGILALLVRHRKLGFRGCIGQTAKDCWRLMFPDHGPVNTNGATNAAPAASEAIVIMPAMSSPAPPLPAPRLTPPPPTVFNVVPAPNGF